MAQGNLFDVVNSVILKFPLLFSHSNNIQLSTLITIIVTYWLLNINYYYYNNNYKKSQ